MAVGAGQPKAAQLGTINGELMATADPEAAALKILGVLIDENLSFGPWWSVRSR